MKKYQKNYIKDHINVMSSIYQKQKLKMVNAFSCFETYESMLKGLFLNERNKQELNQKLLQSLQNF
jgi:hypothetical protein